MNCLNGDRLHAKIIHPKLKKHKEPFIDAPINPSYIIFLVHRVAKREREMNKGFLRGFGFGAKEE
jgi:hypothetical protein